MWTCKKCEKPVYFAERIQSLGFSWHPRCLVCKECSKKLHPGQHAEHDAEPYCHHPCYGALFGPRLFGHGTRHECHGAFGEAKKKTSDKKAEEEAEADRVILEAKLKEFNQFQEGKPGEITTREVNGRMVLEGVLRIYWEIDCLIHLKQEDCAATPTPPATPSGGGGGAVIYKSKSSGDCTLTSNSNNNSSAGLMGSDDSDSDEPLWRDDWSPPSSSYNTPPRGAIHDTPTNADTPTPTNPRTTPNPDLPFASTDTPNHNHCNTPNLMTPTATPNPPSSTHNPPSSTPNPNWPPTPYPTLRPSSSSTSITSNNNNNNDTSKNTASNATTVEKSPVEDPQSPVGGIPQSPQSPRSIPPTGQSRGPQACPVQSYTHHAPPHAPLSHPMVTCDVTAEDDDVTTSAAPSCDVTVMSTSRQEDDNDVEFYDATEEIVLPINDKTLRPIIKKNKKDINTNNSHYCNNVANTIKPNDTSNKNNNNDDDDDSSDSDNMEESSCPVSRGDSSCYATIKLRTVRRRKVDKSITQSLRDSLVFLQDVANNGNRADQNKTCADNGNESAQDKHTKGSENPHNVDDRKLDPANATSLDPVNDNKPESMDCSSQDTAPLRISCETKGKSGVTKRVSFSQYDAPHQQKTENNNINTNNNNNNIVNSSSSPDVRRPAASKGRAVIRRRPGRIMDKKKVKRRCSINGHLYLRETATFHLDSSAPPAVVRVTSLTTAGHLIATVLCKYKIEMSAANFALYVVKDNGERRRLPPTTAPLLTRVHLGPHDSIARIVVADANTNDTDITPQMAEFVRLSLTECRAILRMYDLEEQRHIRAIRAKYDELKFYIKYWTEQQDKEHNRMAVIPTLL